MNQLKHAKQNFPRKLLLEMEMSKPQMTLTINFLQWNCIRIVGYAVASSHLLKCLQTFHTATHQLWHMVKSKFSINMK